MAQLPPAIFFINGDITYPPKPPFFPGTTPSSELQTLQRQLFIDDTMTKDEFDLRVAADPNYPLIVHLQQLRILVIVPKYNDGYHYMAVPNIQFADVVLFLHQGMADVEVNFLGPPGQSYEIQRMTMYSILRAANSPNVVILPFTATRSCDLCNFPFFCDRCHTFSGIKVCATCSGTCGCGCGTVLVDNQGIKSGVVHAPNCDNEFFNTDFVNRK